MRTTQEILTEMEAVQATFPELAAVNSTSEMSYFRMLKNMWAQLVQLVEASWEAVQTKVDAQLIASRVGSLSWYVQQVKAFQLGDQVTVVDGRVGYATIDTSKQIVQQVSVIEDLITGKLLIKAVKTLGMNLSAGELTALRSYVNEVKFAGVQIDVVSLRADSLRLTATVKYDRQVLALDGSSLADPTKFPIQEYLAAYLAVLPFDSVVSWTGITDYMQKQNGIKDFVISASWIAAFGSNSFASFSRETTSLAGHLSLDGGSTFTLV